MSYRVFARGVQILGLAQVFSPVRAVHTALPRRLAQVQMHQWNKLGTYLLLGFTHSTDFIRAAPQ